MKQSAIDWLINRRYGQCFGLSGCPTSLGPFISGNARRLCSKSSLDNSLTFYQANECSRAWCSSFFCLGTFWYKTCGTIGAAAEGFSSLPRALLGTAFQKTMSLHFGYIFGNIAIIFLHFVKEKLSLSLYVFIVIVTNHVICGSYSHYHFI